MNELSLNKSLSRFALIAIALLSIVVLLLLLRYVLVQLFVALIIAAGMSPLVSAVTDPERTRNWRWRPPRALAVLVIYTVACVGLLLIGALVLRGMAVEGQALVVRVPEAASEFQAWLEAQTQAYPFLVELGLSSQTFSLLGLEQYAVTFLRQLAGAASALVSLFGGAITVLFVMFMALYMTVDREAMLEYCIVFVPEQRQAQARRVVSHISARLSAWVIGQFVLCVSIGIGAWIGLSLIGVPGAAILGVIWAVAEFIPGIGPFISAVPSILLGFAVSPTVGLLATAFSIIWSQVANNVVLPRVMSTAVKLNPLIVLLSLLIGSELLGLIGALISIPAAAAIAVVIDEVRIERLESLQNARAVAVGATPAELSPGSENEVPS